MLKTIRTCDFCKKEIFLAEDARGSLYGLIRMDGSGKTYRKFDACDECLEKVINVTYIIDVP